jgi:hypothetical protein
VSRHLKAIPGPEDNDAEAFGLDHDVDPTVRLVALGRHHGGAGDGGRGPIRRVLSRLLS